MLKAMVAYPVTRLEPTERGSKLAVYWIVRAIARHPDGWMTAVARVTPVRALPTTWRLVARGVDATDGAELEKTLNAHPRVRVTRFTVGPDEKEER